jgi:hypothetical protein
MNLNYDQDLSEYLEEERKILDRPAFILLSNAARHASCRDADRLLCRLSSHVQKHPEQQCKTLRQLLFKRGIYNARFTPKKFLKVEKIQDSLKKIQVELPPLIGKAHKFGRPSYIVDTRWRVQFYEQKSREFQSKNAEWYFTGMAPHTKEVIMRIPIRDISQDPRKKHFVGRPTNQQIKKAMGISSPSGPVHIQVRWERQDTTAVVYRRRGGIGVGEINCVSHVSLNPVVSNLEYEAKRKQEWESPRNSTMEAM